MQHYSKVSSRSSQPLVRLIPWTHPRDRRDSCTMWSILLNRASGPPLAPHWATFQPKLNSSNIETNFQHSTLVPDSTRLENLTRWWDSHQLQSRKGPSTHESQQDHIDVSDVDRDISCRAWPTSLGLDNSTQQRRSPEMSIVTAGKTM